MEAFPSGKTRLSPDKTTSRSISSGKNHDPPDGKPLRLAHPIHFGRQCATGSVYWHLPAKVELKKSHFGKPPLTECVLRHPPCQSELAEASTTFCGPSASRQYTLRAMPSSATMEGTISSEMEGPVRRVSFAASNNETAFCKKYHRCTKHRKHLVDKNLMRHY